MQLTRRESRRHTQVFCAIMLLIVASVVGCGAPPVAAPTSYASYNSKAGTFACEYPEGWELKDGGMRGPEWATFTAGSALIRMSADVSGSLMAGDNPVGADLPPTVEPVHDLHVRDQVRAEDSYAAYTEIAEPNVYDAKLGPARLSEFTATTTFGGGLHGYRVTMLGHNKRLVTYCVCPESEWATLKPAFDHVLSTLKRGSTQ